MPSQPDTQRFLVKVQPGLGPALTLAAGTRQFKLEPLFTSIGQSPGGALAATVAPAWHILTPPEPAGETHPWDACHQLVHDGFGIAGAPAPEFAEPDIQQQWFVAHPHDSDREFLQSVFRSVALLPGLGGLLDDGESALWLVDPPADADAASRRTG